MRRLLWLVLVFTLLGGTSAEGARQWGPPVPPGPAGTDMHQAVLTSADELVVLASSETRMFAAIHPPGGGTPQVQELGSREHRYHQATLATGGGVTYAMWEDAAGTMRVVRRAPGGSFGAAQAFPASYQPDGQLAAGPRGDAVLTFVSGTQRLASFSLPGGGWSDPQPAPEGTALVGVSGEAIYLRARGAELVAQTLRPGQPASAARVLATGATGVQMSPPVMDASGRVAIAWLDSAPPADATSLQDYGPLRVTLWDGDAVRTLDLGRGRGARVATNSHGRGIVSWSAPSEPDFHGFVYDITTAARLDLGTGVLGERFAPLQGSWTMPAVSENGDVMVVTAQHEAFATRARPSGLLKAIHTIGCFGNGGHARFAAIDSRGQGIAIVYGTDSGGVVRDSPSNTWGRMWCGYTPIGSLPEFFPPDGYRTADKPVGISMRLANDLEATRQTWRWDLDDDGTFETDTGEADGVSRRYPEGVHKVRIEQTAWFGDESERRIYRGEFQVWPSWATPGAPLPPVKAPQLTLARRSLRSALRSGLRATVRTPATADATVEVRRRLPRGGSTLLARRTRRMVADRSTPVSLRFRRAAKRRLRGVRALPIEVRLLQDGRRLARKRATLRDGSAR